MAIAYGLKVNLSVAVVAMVNHTAVAQSDILHGADNAALESTEPVCQASNSSVKQQVSLALILNLGQHVGKINLKSIK